MNSGGKAIHVLHMTLWPGVLPPAPSSPLTHTQVTHHPSGPSMGESGQSPKEQGLGSRDGRSRLAPWLKHIRPAS